MPKPSKISSTNSVLNDLKSYSLALNFNLHPDLFISAVSDCILDQRCRILYHHVGKSGGTTIEDTFFRIFPVPGSKEGHLKSCCGPALLGRLNEDDMMRRQYCEAKFASYQVSGKHILELVNGCMNLTNGVSGSGSEDTGDDLQKYDRTVIITSLREPIQRCLSSIHQMCNKHLGSRSNATILACMACRYDVHTEIWQKIVNMTNEHYIGIELVLTTANLPSVQALSIDMLDINDFFAGLRIALAPKGVEVPETTWRNPEKSTVCSFQMPSEMMKDLSQSLAIYRNVTAGGYR